MVRARVEPKKIPRKQKLTKAERNLIENPPTEKTWLCPGPHVSDKGVVYELPNNGSSKTCWLCQRPKPPKAKKVWPSYVEACKKAGIEPGMTGTSARRTLIEQGYSE